MSDLKQSAIANSLRGKLATTAAANDKKRKCRPDDFDAADVGLAEVIEEFSRAPDSTPDFRILVTEMVLGDRDQTEIEGSSSQDAQQSAIGYIVGNRVYIETRPPTYV